jgi:spore germination protein YaaH
MIVRWLVMLLALLVTGPGAPAARAEVAAYLVAWDPRSRVPATGGVLTEANPVWFRPAADGALVPTADPAAVARVESDAAARGVAVAPSIANVEDGRWQGDLVAAIVADPGRRSAHVAAIVDLVRARHWPGIDIDYESLPAGARAAYSAFVAELAAALHRVPATLSVTVHAKTAEPGDWAGARAQDWHAIGAAADEVRVMAYDYSQEDSPPGPIAPPDWVGRVLKLATASIPAGRVVLGVPTYGYDWTAGAGAVPVQWADATATARAHGVTPARDATEPWYAYVDSRGRHHTVWYEDARSLAAKLAVAKRYGVTRLVLWRLGGEDPAIWSTLRE